MSMTRQEVLLALAGGREVQREFRDGSTYFSSSWAWSCLDPKEHWEPERWRIKPTPTMVPLGLEDVPPGSAIRQIGHTKRWSVLQGMRFDPGDDLDGVAIAGTVGMIKISWEELRGYEITKDCGKTWSKCEKEVVE